MGVELYLSFDPYSFLEINNFFIFKFTCFFSFLMSIYEQIIIFLACYRAICMWTNETHNNKYTLKSTPLATHNKTLCF